MKRKNQKTKTIPVPANLPAKKQAPPAKDPSAIETFLLLATAGITNKDKVLVQFYPDFLKEVGEEIQKKLQLLKTLQKENAQLSKQIQQNKKDQLK